MNKYLHEFVPVNFQKAWIWLFIIGIICIVVKGIDIVSRMLILTNGIFYVGLTLIILSIFLFIFVPDNK